MKAGPGRADKPWRLEIEGQTVMRTATLGPLGEVSRLTLGGGGIGQIWGENTKDEALATLTAAIDGGITVLDAAPMYRNCEAFIGEVFGSEERRVGKECR